MSEGGRWYSGSVTRQLQLLNCVCTCALDRLSPSVYKSSSISLSNMYPQCDWSKYTNANSRCGSSVYSFTRSFFFLSLSLSRFLSLSSRSFSFLLSFESSSSYNQKTILILTTDICLVLYCSEISLSEKCTTEIPI